jgi:hypothetical protein
MPILFSHWKKTGNGVALRGCEQNAKRTASAVLASTSRSTPPGNEREASAKLESCDKKFESSEYQEAESLGRFQTAFFRFCLS